MIYLSFLIYPYASHSPVPHSLIQSPYWWAYTDGSYGDKPFFNHLAQCLSLFKPFTTMHIQCLPLPPCLLFKFYVLPAWWAVRLLWWPLTECSNASMCFSIYKVFLLLFHCCILLEIKLTTTATANATTANMYMIGDAGACVLTQRLVVFHLELHLHPVC